NNGSAFFDFADVVVEDMTITHAGTSAILDFSNDQGDIRVSNNTVASGASNPATWLVYLRTSGDVITDLTSIRFDGNTVTGGAGLYAKPINGSPFTVYACNNTLTVDGQGISLGTNTTERVYDIGAIYVCDNTVTKLSNNAGHGILIGRGILGGLVQGNVVDVTAADASSEFAMVSKANGVTFLNNMLTGVSALSAKGAQGCVFMNNTALGTGVAAVRLYNDSDWGAGDGAKIISDCVFYNNIFEGGTSTSCINIEDIEA
ncbi:unnamed protein product, partial [marine sediment metagenome]